MKLQQGTHVYDVTIDNIPMRFELDYKTGDSPLIICLHGLVCSRDSFRHILLQPGFDAFSILIPDLIGFGESGKPEDFPYTMEAQAAVCRRLLERIPHNGLHIVAHSMGGAVGLLLCDLLDAPPLSFANLEGNLVAEDCGYVSRTISRASLARFQARGYQRLQKSMADVEMLKFDKTTPAVVHKSALPLVQLSDNGVLLEKFRTLTCAKGYFYGEENKGMPVLEKLDFPEIYEIPACGHGMMLENPEAFYAALSRFIREAG
ncbi:MAG: alpha/beta hydrolase [bacterium]|nr:alpha/beta hydrolase [bacterium]